MCGTITSISLPDLGACIGQWKLIDDIKTQVSINWQIFPLANIFLVGFQPSLVEQGYWYAFSIRLSPETPLAEIVYVLQWPANDSQLSWNIFNITKTNVTIIGRIPSIINQFQSWITSGSLVVQLTLNTSDIMSFFNGNKCFYIVYMRGQFYGNQPLPPDDIILNKSLCISCQVVNIMPTVNLNNTTYTTITRTLPPLSSAVDVSTIGSTATSGEPGSILFSSTATVSSQLPQNSVVAFISNGLANVSSSNSSLLQFDPASNNLTNAPAVILTTSSESITNVDNTTIASRASTLTAVISSPGISTNKNVFPTDETTGTIYSSTAGSLATTQSPSGGTVGNSGSSTVVSTNTTEAVTSASIGSIFSSTAGSLATTQFQSGGTVGNIGSSAAVTQLSSASSLSNSTANGGISMSVSIANSHASTVVSTTTNGLSSAPLITSNGYATTILTANSSSASGQLNNCVNIIALN
ncbi:unnamed protein product [Rotaria socialis]|uniref:Uncharacterized protein n=1 Tax=Rotaria socialis TaxID=392032 RepID=A0A818C2U0_9BILA|nr:unnamed protein product [Rotaria socialis]